MKLKKIYLTTLAMILLSSEAIANISIFPYSVDFQDKSRKRVQSVRVINSSDTVQTYRVSVINFDQDEKGNFTEVEDNGVSAKKYLSWSPRQFTLKPNEVQTINIARKSLSGAKDGEYVSHLKISEVDMGTPKQNKNLDANSNTLSMELKALFAVTIPVTIEKGEAGFSKTSLIGYKNIGGKKVNFSFRREGTKSSRFNAVILDEKGEELGRVNGIKIYLTTETLSIDVPLNKNLNNVNALLKLEDAKSKEEIFRQTIRL